VAVAASLELALNDQNRPVDIYVAKLLVALGLKTSRTEAERQVTAGVNIDGVTSSDKLIHVERRPARIAIRVGKQARIAVIE
jgi:tyrosyl-tRNA synthetase